MASYWKVYHRPDTTETGVCMCVDYLHVEWNGHEMQRSSEDLILREWCRQKYGAEVDYVQGVAPCPGWIISKATKEDYERAQPKNWGGYTTDTKRYRLAIGKKNSSDSPVQVVYESEGDEPFEQLCPTCGQVIHQE